MDEEESLYKVIYNLILPDMFGTGLFNSQDLIHYDKTLTKYKALKIIHKWESFGLIVKDCYGGQDEDGYPHCYHGYALTDKAEGLPAFQKAKEEVSRYVQAFLDATGEELEDV